MPKAPVYPPAGSSLISMKRFLVTVGVVVLLGMVAPAHADGGSDDERFLRALSEAGIEYSDPQQAIDSAKAVCQSMAAGNTINQTARGVKNANPELSATLAAEFVAIAQAMYCAASVSDTAHDD